MCTIILPLKTYSSIEPELAILHDTSELLSFNNDNGPHGLFNDKYPLHLIPHPVKENTFTNRISYHTRNDSYYENGIVDKKYLEFWDKGVLYYENLKYATHYSYDRTKDTTALFSCNHGSNRRYPSIVYKFDYSSYENLEISLLDLKLKCFSGKYKWVISISTDKSNTSLVGTISNSVFPSIEWIRIKETNKNISEILTDYVKDKNFFYLKVEMCCNTGIDQLFPSTKIKQSSRWNPFENNNNNDIEKNFTFDITVELLSTESFKNLNFKSIEKGIVPSRNIANNKNKLVLGGLFNDKYRFNVLQSRENKNIYTHRISYDVIENAYYENGIYDAKYLKRWDRGTFTYNNIYYYLESSPRYVRCRTLGYDEKNLPAYITWKFDYRAGNLYLSSLKLKLRLSDIEKIKWSIQLLPTRKNPNPEFKSIDLLQKREIVNSHDYYLNDFDNFIDLTEVVKDEYGFILKAYLNEIETHENYSLFRIDDRKPSLDCRSWFDFVVKKGNDKGFCMDIKTELKPNIICDLNNNIEVIDENLLFNDKNTSDFIIKLESLPKENNDITEKIFYTHTKVLSSRSDYFHALLNSNMIESRNGYLKFNDISYHTLEKLLLFIYTDNIENINEFEIDDWIDLLYASSKFLLPKLFQICELYIRNLTNFDNLERKSTHATRGGT